MEPDIIKRVKFLLALLLLSINSINGDDVTDILTPTSYSLDVTIGNNVKTYQITAHIEFTMNENTQKLLFHFDGTKSDITQIMIDEEKPQSFSITKNILTIKLKTQMGTGDAGKVSITMKSRQIETDKVQGIFSKQSKDWKIVGANFFPYHARQIFPCVDIPEQMAGIELTVTYPNTFDLSVSAKPGKTNKGKEKSTITFEKTKDMALNRFGFYLLSGYVKTFNNAYVPKAYKGFIEANQYFATIIGMEPFSSMSDTVSGEVTLNYVMVDDLPSDYVVQRGIIAIRPEKMILGKNVTSEENLNIYLTISKAISEFFFGDVLTPAWKDYWLSTSVADYLSYKTVAENDNSGVYDLMTIDIQQDALKNSWKDDSLTVAWENDIVSKLEIDKILTSIGNKKGTAILRMLEMVNSKCIIESLKSLIQDNPFSLIDTDNFIQSLNNCKKFKENLPKNKNLKDILHPWLYETGYPLLTVDLSTSKKVTLSQEPYSENNEEVKNTKWVIPVTFTQKSKSDFDNTKIYWVTDNSNTFDDKQLKNNDWVVVNLHSQGFYRVMYTSDDFQNMQKSMKNFPSELLTQFVENSFELSLYGDKMVLNDALSIFNNFNDVENIGPWKVAVNVFQTLHYLYFSKDDLNEQLHDYVQNKIGNIYGALQWENDDQTNLLEGVERALIIDAACDFNLKDCINTAANLYKKNEYEKPEYNDVKHLIKCYGISDLNDPNKWKTLLNKWYKKDDPESTRRSALFSLGCPLKPKDNDNSKSIKAYLTELYQNSVILKEDAPAAYEYIYSRPRNLDQALYFFAHNFKSFKKLGDDILVQMINGISTKLSTDYHKSLLDVLKNIKDLSGNVKQAVKNAGTELDTRIKEIEGKKDIVQNWLQAFEDQTTEPNTGSTDTSYTSDSSPLSSTDTGDSTDSSSTSSTDKSSTSSHKPETTTKKSGSVAIYPNLFIISVLSTILIKFYL